MRQILLCSMFCLYLLLSAARLDADEIAEGGLVQLNFGPYIQHYNPNPKYNAYPWFTGLEWESPSRWEIGGAVFSNSYNQPSGYLYGGKRFIRGTPDEHLFFKITAGVIIGYFKPYDRKIPLNADGIGLGLVPAVGYKYQRFTTQIAILSTSALMLNLGYDIWK